jgi:hypothetical protein
VLIAISNDQALANLVPYNNQNLKVENVDCLATVCFHIIIISHRLLHRNSDTKYTSNCKGSNRIRNIMK